MKTFAAAILAIAVSGSVASAASLTKTSYTTARQAALHGGAYAFDKAAGYDRFNARNLKVTRTIDGRGTMQKYQVETKAQRSNGQPLKEKIVTVRKDSPGKYRAYIPNRHVFTPPSAGNP